MKGKKNGLRRSQATTKVGSLRGRGRGKGRELPFQSIVPIHPSIHRKRKTTKPFATETLGRNDELFVNDYLSIGEGRGETRME